jgi:hypothetical protein
MIDVVIPLGKQSPFDNVELRYTLRGIEKYLRNYRNIVIVGDKPKWLTNVIHIPAADPSFKDKNIMNKVKLACATDITEEFLFMNDDHFLKSTIEANNYPYYFDGNLTEWRSAKRMYDPYREAITNTIEALTKNERPTKHFDIHCPIVYNKKLFPLIMDQYNWSVRSAYTVKSLYCNTLGIVGEPMNDCKINDPHHSFAIADKIVHRHVFSVGDRGMNEHMFNYLDQIYSKKSKYEL